MDTPRKGTLQDWKEPENVDELVQWNLYIIMDTLGPVHFTRFFFPLIERFPQYRGKNCIRKFIWFLETLSLVWRFFVLCPDYGESTKKRFHSITNTVDPH